MNDPLDVLDRYDHEAALYYGEFGILDEDPPTPEDYRFWDEEDERDRLFESGYFDAS